MSATAQQTFSPSIRKYLLGGLIAGLVGAVIANLWYLVWQAAGGASYAELNIFTILLFGVIPGVLGGLIYYGLTRRTQRPTTIFVVVGLVFTTLSILPNFFAPADPAPGFAAASSPMHYIVALSVLIIVPLFTRNRR